MAISSHCLTTLPTKMSALNSYMQQSPYYGDSRCIFEDLLPCYCYATKANSRTIRSRVSQPASASKEANLVNGKLMTACHQNSETDSCAVWVSCRQKNCHCKNEPTNQNWTADFTFSRIFFFLVPSSRGGQVPVLRHPADAHAVQYCFAPLFSHSD